MKKITGIMLAVVMLVSVLSVSAFAVNAPLTAAEELAKVAGLPFGEASGSITFAQVDPILPWVNGTAKTTGGTVVDYSNNSFDVAVYFEGFGYLGSNLRLLYNPEIVMPLQLEDNSVYTLKVGRNAISSSLVAHTKELYGEDAYYELAGGFTSATDYGTSYKNYTEGTATMDDVVNDYLDGVGTYVFASATGVVEEEAYYYETYRWPFEVVAENNDWYRTKIQGLVQGGVNDLSNTPIYPALDGVIYIENANYDGPAFDIVGAMKADEGKLRFGSVYFADGGVHDNETVIVDAGVVLYPTDLLDDATLTLDTVGAVKISAAGYYDINGDEYTYTGVLTGLEGNEDMYITARSFVKYMDGEDEVVVYSDPIARSLAWVGDNADMQ